jgi:transaldolase
MSIFIDSSNYDEIAKYYQMGIARGVTTNPTIIKKDGVIKGEQSLQERITAIATLVKPYPVALEVTCNDRQGMLEQARKFVEYADNIVIKIPIHGPNGELDNLEVIHLLQNEYQIQVNTTAMMSAQQVYLAASAGATFVSLFGGRVNNMGYNCLEEIKKARQLLDRFYPRTKLIVCSTREILNVVEWLAAGAHIVTVIPSLLAGMIVHPYTKETVQMFLKDANAAPSDS